MVSGFLQILPRPLLGVIGLVARNLKYTFETSMTGVGMFVTRNCVRLSLYGRYRYVAEMGGG